MPPGEDGHRGPRAVAELVLVPAALDVRPAQPLENFIAVGIRRTHQPASTPPEVDPNRLRRRRRPGPAVSRRNATTKPEFAG